MPVIERERESVATLAVSKWTPIPLKCLANENRTPCLLHGIAPGSWFLSPSMSARSGGLVHTSLKDFRPGSQIKRSVSAGTCTNLRPPKLSALTIHLFRFFLFFVQFLSSSSSLGICIASWASGKGSSDFLSPFLLVLFGIFPSPCNLLLDHP
jgi:hypothetical protein